MRPKAKSVTQIKYESLSEAYDRLKKDNIKLSTQLTKLQSDFDELARIKSYQLLDIVRGKIPELKPKDYPQVTSTDPQFVVK